MVRVIRCLYKSEVCIVGAGIWCTRHICRVQHIIFGIMEWCWLPYVSIREHSLCQCTRVISWLLMRFCWATSSIISLFFFYLKKIIYININICNKFSNPSLCHIIHLFSTFFFFFSLFKLLILLIVKNKNSISLY